MVVFRCKWCKCGVNRRDRFRKTLTYQAFPPSGSYPAVAHEKNLLHGKALFYFYGIVSPIGDTVTARIPYLSPFFQGPPPRLLGALRGSLHTPRYQQDPRMGILPPIQRLPAAVTKILVLPLHGDPAPGADRVGLPVAELLDRHNGHRPAKSRLGDGGGPPRPPPPHPAASAVTAPASGFCSSTSSTSARRHSAWMVGFASPCSILRR